ncbi:hypothetical protein M8C21_026760, partial [Ambrosia artemisiifolia]
MIDLDSSDDDSSTSGNKTKKKSGDDVVLPAGFLDPLTPKDVAPRVDAPSCGMDHVRVHPRFLHSNATSHKWVLGAFAELLDNSLDEFCNGATYVNIDMLRNKKDGNRMLLIEDNGGGMDPDKMRQYGNGFKTSSMRLGADVIVFSRCSAKDGKRSTQSIGLLSYTFLRSTGKEDIVVPMSYASILYLRIPPGFRMILRGKDIQHHNIVNDMMMTTEITYRPQPGADKVSKDSSIVAVVTMGFVKDAKAHIDVQGYNVYHKNRLIKPFWRLWNSTGSDGRGVIGVLEANFVEPAHDKQGFERTIVLSRLETRLIQMQKTYWPVNRRGHDPSIDISWVMVSDYNPFITRPDSSLDYTPETSSKRKKVASKPPVSLSNKSSSYKHQKLGSVNGFGENGTNFRGIFGEGPSSPNLTPLHENIHDDNIQTSQNLRHTNGSSHVENSANKSIPKDLYQSARSTQHPAYFSEAGQYYSPYEKSMQIVTHPQSMSVVANESIPDLNQLVEENRRLKEKLARKDEDIIGDLLSDLERERNRRKALEAQVQEAREKCENLSKEQEIAIDTFAEERETRDIEQEALRKKLE